MIVTDKNYFMETKLLEKLDLMIKRSSGKNKMDNWIVVDGDEGLGKSTMSVACAYYVAQKMGRDFDVSKVFFDPDTLIEYGTKTKEQVLILDESVFGGLSGDAATKLGKKLIKFSMVIRKKKHFIFLNIPKFFKLNEYLMVDRSVALIHVYARGGTQLGRFVYLSDKKKEYLFHAYRKSKKRDYKKYYTFRGSFPNVLGKILDEKEYDKKKDDAILAFGSLDEINKGNYRMECFERLSELNKEKNLGITQKKIGELFDVTRQTIANYTKKSNLKVKCSGQI